MSDPLSPRLRRGRSASVPQARDYGVAGVRALPWIQAIR